MFTHLSLSIAILAFVVTNTSAHEGRLWNNYEDIFVDQIYDVFHSEDALKHSHEFAGNVSAYRGVLDFACASYSITGFQGNFKV